MVGTRPINCLGKIPDGTFINLSPKKPRPKKKTRRKIVMEEQQTPEKKEMEESPTALDGALLENFAAGAEIVPTLEDIFKAGREEADPPQTEEPTKKTKGESSSQGKKKKRETPTASSTKNTPAGSSRTESAKTKTKDEEEAGKKVSDEESSGDNEEEKENKDEEEAEDDEEEAEDEEEADEEEEDDEEEDEDVKLLREEGPPAKRVRVQTRLARKEKAPIVGTEELVANKEVVVPKKLDLKLLSDLGIKEEVDKLFNGIGWGRFLKWETDVYEELVREFYGGLEIEHAKTVPLGIKFKLLGEQRKVKINEFDLALKMVSLLDLTTKGYQEAVTVMPNYPDKKWNSMWAELAKKEDFKSCENKGTSLKNSAMRMCHRSISYNLYGKKDSSNSVSKSELFILWAMHKKIRLNFAAFAVSHMRSILGRKEQRLSLAHLPTVFARMTCLTQSLP